MPSELQRLERFLGSAGSGASQRADIDTKLSQRIFAQEMLRPAGGDFATRKLLDRDQVDETVAEMRTTMEWFTRNLRPLGAQTETFRRLEAKASVTGPPVSAQVIAEAIAAYRLLLGREPDDGGFRTFAQHREQDGLVSALRNLLGSPVAIAHVAPDHPVGMNVAVVTVSSAAVSILGAVAIDSVLGSIGMLRRSVDQLAGRVETIVHALGELTTLSQLRFDGEASRR
jgi:hypothetical protein